MRIRGTRTASVLLLAAFTVEPCCGAPVLPEQKSALPHVSGHHHRSTASLLLQTLRAEDDAISLAEMALKQAAASEVRDFPHATLSALIPPVCRPDSMLSPLDAFARAQALADRLHAVAKRGQPDEEAPASVGSSRL